MRQLHQRLLSISDYMEADFSHILTQGSLLPTYGTASLAWEDEFSCQLVSMLMNLLCLVSARDIRTINKDMPYNELASLR